MRCIVAILILSVLTTQGFIIDDLLGGPRCTADTDCSNGCCHITMSIFGSTGSCQPYLLPGASCMEGDTHHCGCMPGYKCETSDLSSIAVEAGTHLKGYCKPQDGTTGGPQIAVEGGR